MVTKELINISSVSENDVIIGYGLTDKDELELIKRKIDNGINSISNLEKDCLETINILNKEIDRLTCQADKVDYIFSICSGIICGAIDSVFVGEFSLDTATVWGKDKVDGFVRKVANMQGFKSEDLSKCVNFLENKYPFAGDSVTGAFGGGLHHHLRDFSHHPNIMGLAFSMLTQFTGKVYGTDAKGAFISVAVNDSTLIGTDFSRKIILGVVNWFFHMVSDMAGSSGSIAYGKYGTGLPGPIVSTLKIMSALPIFQNKEGNNELSKFISRLFNGTLLANKDQYGHLDKSSIIKFDFRTELGIGAELGRQSIPVIINECLVRGFYFFRRVYQEFKNVNPKSFEECLRKINWEKCIPFKNRTIQRMITVSSGTFVATDLIDAAVRAAISGGAINPASFVGRMALRINIVGVGRFVIALGTDIYMGIQKRKKENECLREVSRYLELRNANLHLHSAKMWIAIKEWQKVQTSLTQQQNETELLLLESLKETSATIQTISPLKANIESYNDGLLEELSDLIF